MNQTAAQIQTDVRERVIDAAEKLYQQAGRERFPTVDAVRRLSGADMNRVTILMREWRQSQTTQAAPVAVMIPDAVQQANAAAVAAMWTQATELANQSLRTAQAAWEAERQDLDDMRSELATGYEVQAAELDAAKSQLADNTAALDVANGRLADNAAKLAAAVARANTAEARAVEIEHRANDLNAALVAAQDAAKNTAAELEAERKRHQVAITKADQEASDLR
ncbi:MAG: DNA-binding protein, partial [Moraxellaceae bacterium]|nr:DNA-binding protein [Moraxellaceae bacterium]